MLKHKIILIPFPFDDLSSNKVRPALCLTEAIGLHHHVILAFITSQIPPALLPTDVVIASSDTAFAATGLRVSSTLQLHRLMTVTISLIRRDLGTLPTTLQPEVEQRLRTLFVLV